MTYPTVEGQGVFFTNKMKKISVFQFAGKKSQARNKLLLKVNSKHTISTHITIRFLLGLFVPKQNKKTNTAAVFTTEAKGKSTTI